MRQLIIIVLIILFSVGMVNGEAKKADRPLDVGIATSADPHIHEAIYKVLEKKGIKCDGLSTKKDGIVTIINPSSNKPLITAEEIGEELTKIKQAQDIEAKIQAEIRAMAIKSLKQKGEIPQDYKRRSDF